MYSFSYLEPVCCSMSSSNCCFLTCIQVSQRAGQVFWYSHLFQNFPQFVVIHTVKGFGIANKAEIDVFLELSCFFDDPADVGNLISCSSAFSKTSLNIWKFMVHVLLKPVSSILGIWHYPAEVNGRGERKVLERLILVELIDFSTVSSDDSTFPFSLPSLPFSSVIPVPLPQIFHKGKTVKGPCCIIRCQKTEIFIVPFPGFPHGWSWLISYELGSEEDIYQKWGIFGANGFLTNTERYINCNFKY